MPLPPALAARLAKRGIINPPKQSEPEPASLAEEEIIAEDYDDTPQQEPPGRKGADSFDPYLGYSGCPNKWNVYHECTPTCRDIWRDIKSLDMEYDKRRIKMLSKYPMPAHWQEVLDAGIGRYYYWNTETDLVSWLPPGHSKCQVSRAAASLRKQMILERNVRVQEENKKSGFEPIKKRKASESTDEEDDDENMSDNSKDSDESDSEDEKPPPPDPKEKKAFSNLRNQSKERDRRPKKFPKEDLDPMDPASYGECERGTWSSGLPQQNEARTGVDSTASGPLFQMRPYPNPGAVLRANASANITGPKKPS